MSELEKYRAEERKRLIYGVKIEAGFDNQDTDMISETGGFSWR